MPQSYVTALDLKLNWERLAGPLSVLSGNFGPLRVLPHVILILLAVAVAVLPSGSIGAEGAPESVPATISITPNQGPPGTTSVTVSGANFAPSTVVTITYDATSVGTVDAGPGSWTYSFIVPASSLGSHSIGAGTASATFTVESTISISPQRGPLGTRVTVKGNGFAGGQSGIPVLLDTEQVVSVSADSLGSFFTTFRVPAISVGSYPVNAGNAYGQTFTVTSALSIGTSSGPPGTTVNVTGSGFEANARLRIIFDGTEIRSVTADNAGSTSASFQVPVAPSGRRSINVSGPSGGVLQADFTVTPLLSLDRLNVSPGASVTATGVGFAANEQGITVTLGQTAVATGILADADGSWTDSFLIPSLPAGSHTVRALGSLTSAGSVPALKLRLGADLRLERSSGPPGTTLNVSGSGFRPRDSIIVTVGDGLAESGVSANVQGAWTANITIPTSPGGRIAIRASGTRGQPMEADFLVTPTVNLSQPTGAPGSAVKIEGKGFRANQNGIPISFGTDVVAAPTANSHGSWSTIFTIPPSPSGTYSIEVSSSNRQLEVPFTVTPGVSLGITRGEPRTSVSVKGSGFGANERGISVTLEQTTVISGILADAYGSWATSFIVPSLPAGSYTVLVQGSQTTAASVSEVIFTLGADLRLERRSGPPGTALRVSGAGFRARESITVTVGDGLTESDVSANDQGAWTANVTIPPAPGGRVAIRASGTSGLPVEAEFIVTPTVYLSQPAGPPGSLVTIEGEGFKANQNGIPVRFGSDVVASPSANSHGSWTTTVTIPPSTTGTYLINVSGPNGQLEVPFTVTPAVSLVRTRGEPGNSVSVKGWGFGANEKDITVTLEQTRVASGISADADGSWTASFLVPSIPAGSYGVRASGALTSSGDLRDDILSIAPNVAVSPTGGQPGSAVKISGRGFGANQRDIVISYDGTTIATVLSADSAGSFATSFIVPPSASGLHFISHSGADPGTTGGTEVSFQVMPSISIDQPKAPPGSAVTVTGLGFVANETAITITFDDTPMMAEVPTDSQGSFTANVLVPPSPAGPHVIHASGTGLTALSNLEQKFIVTQTLAMSKSSGNVGGMVEVLGFGFAGSTAVTLIYGDQPAEVTTADAAGSFRLEFSIPPSKHGGNVITVVDEQGHEAQVTFYVEDSPPAAPNLLAPENGANGGILGGFRPAPKWAPVDDPSGVTYILQIDTDPDFSDPILDKRGLDRPFYALTTQEALPRGKYYWRVKAVDWASNEGPWSSALVVKSGILPLWVIPTLAVLGVMLVGSAGYAVVHHRRGNWGGAVAFPELAGQVGVKPALTAARPAAALFLRPSPRLALPGVSRRKRRLSPEEQARLNLVLDFMRSLPLLQVSCDLAWLDGLLEARASVNGEVYDQVLQGQVDLRYQPAWLRHPTYEEVKRILEGDPFLQGLEDYIGAVDDIAADTVSLLRQVYGDVTALLPAETRKVYQWRYVLAVVQYALAWFRGTYLREPSAGDYDLVAASDSAEESLLALRGQEFTPFSGSLVEGLSEKEALDYRDLHIQLRTNYTNSQEARLLAVRMASLEVLQEQLTKNLEELHKRS